MPSNFRQLMELASSSSSRRPAAASFLTQADALLRKNIAFQKRNLITNVGIVSFPAFLCILLVVLQGFIDRDLRSSKNRCGCACVDYGAGNSSCHRVCGIQYSSLDQVGSCPIPSPPRWPALLQLPRPESRAARTPGSALSTALPDESCRSTGSCPATLLITGRNRTLAQSVAGNFFTDAASMSLNYLDALLTVASGTDTPTGYSQFIEPVFVSDRPLYIVQSQCRSNFIDSVAVEFESITLKKDLKCVQGLSLWLDDPSEVNNQLFNGYLQAKADRKPNEFIAAFDFSNTNENAFNVNIWYNSTYANNTGFMSEALLRVPRSVNMVSNAYLNFVKGNGTMMQLEFVKEMPKPETTISLDFSSVLGALFFTWVIQLLFPVILTYLVYEKQQNLKLIMKMHGLNDGPYWFISYAYFFALSSVYIICFVLFGSLIGLKFFRLNEYSLQFVFYFIYVNLQIAMAFLVVSLFSDVKTTTVTAYIYVFGSGLLGEFFFRLLVQDDTFPRAWIVVLEILPGFSLYRGLYEFGQYAFNGDRTGTSGMHWENLGDSVNGIKDVLLIMTIEWLVFLLLAYSLNLLSSFRNGVRRNNKFYLRCCHSRTPLSPTKSKLEVQDSRVFIETDRPDVSEERRVVEQLLEESGGGHAIICDSLKKVYLGRDGNPEKHAVQGLSLAISRGECFGMLGPNGAGKTSFINMMTGLLSPTSGTALIYGLDIRSNMDEIYSSMGVCPQHDLLWETLTGREHLLFYARLKNLKGSALIQAVDESLKTVNLFHGGVADKQAGKYSGGMKRRLSVAISLIGDPKVVYMDEPSTGLDPASRNNLWNVVKNAKKDRAIILTTHSMEEAEVLCDRLGVFVGGSLQCIGNPKELKARYGGSFVFTMTTSSNAREEVEVLVRGLSPSAKKIYDISGTQKFEMPKHEVRIANVFRAVENAKTRFTIQAWGLADTTLEDVFIKVAKEVQSLDDMP